LGNEGYYQALNGVTLTIFQGEFVSIMGPSGSGKSTTMHIMGALDSPTTGTYRFKGRDISRYTPDERAKIRNREIGFVFQTYNLLPRTSVIKNVERPMIYGHVPPEDRFGRAMAVLKLVHIEDKANNLSNHISGGQIQRVAIARALVMDPALLLADEPTGNLDSKTARDIMTLFTNLHKSGRTIVVITHDEDVAHFATRTIRIVDGAIRDGT
jgi:putative ABC transport system ATP-binding protein